MRSTRPKLSMRSAPARRACSTANSRSSARDLADAERADWTDGSGNRRLRLPGLLLVRDSGTLDEAHAALRLHDSPLHLADVRDAGLAHLRLDLREGDPVTAH